MFSEYEKLKICEKSRSLFERDFYTEGVNEFELYLESGKSGRALRRVFFGKNI